MIVGLMRYRSAASFSVLARERPLLGWMAVGSIAGAGLGGSLLGVVPAQTLTLLLSIILAVSAIKVFRHHTRDHRWSDQANVGWPEATWHDKLMKPERDTPRLAFDLLPWRVTVVILFCIVAVAVAAGLSTIAQAHAMRGMAMEMGQPGYANQAEMGAAAFLTMWITMMTAMMLPTIAPMVLAHHAVALRRNEGALSTLASVAGYLIVWWAIGIVMWLGYTAFAQWNVGGAPPWLPLLAGGILVCAGAYQFSRWKQHCADMCRSPLAFLLKHDSRRGVRPAFTAGMMHAAYCVGCCWAAMMVLVVVGLMNLPGMAILFVLFFVEKNWKHGRTVASLAGIVMIALGAAIAVHGPLLTAISN
jgi:predicted metal-binding membrane protein